jgi:hypothetical protein
MPKKAANRRGRKEFEEKKEGGCITLIAAI